MLSPHEDRLERALRDQSVRDRYDAKVARAGRDDCWFWTGAIHPKGHGRFWVATFTDARSREHDLVVIAHRFGWALAHGLDAMLAAPVLAHECDEASCQNPGHIVPSTITENREDWLRRRGRVGSPLRDVRGPAGRARAIRDAALLGQPLGPVLALGQPAVDAAQLTLW